VLEKAHHNKFTLNKEKNINDHSKSSLVFLYKMRILFQRLKKEREKIRNTSKKEKK
jgi:hypothetical protein